MGTQQRNGFNPTGNFQKIKLPWTNLEIPWIRPETHGEIDIDKLAQNFEAMQDRMEENHRYLDRVDWGQGGGTRWATIVVAPSNASALSKAGADYVCSGGADDVILLKAITALLSSNSLGGKLILLEGVFILSSSISFAIGSGQELVIEGMSSGSAKQANTAAATIINGVAIGATNAINAAGGSLTVKNVVVRGSATGSAIRAANCRLNVHQCATYGLGGIVIFTSAGGVADGSFITNNTISTSGGTGVDISSADHAVVAHNTISIAGSVGGSGASGISAVHSLGISSQFTVMGNDITADTNSDGIRLGDNGTTESICVGNTIRSSGSIGMWVRGFAQVVGDNLIRNCAKGIVVAGNNDLISGNIISHTGTPTSAIDSTGDNNYITGNKCATSVGSSILVAGNNSSVVYNEAAIGGPASVTDTGTGTRREADWLLTGQTANINARVGVRKNTAGSTFLRRRLDFIEGANITITEVDDAGTEEVHVTIAAASAGNVVSSELNGGAVASTRGILNLIEGAGISMTVVDDVPNTRTNITVTATGGAASGSDTLFRSLACG